MRSSSSSQPVRNPSSSSSSSPSSTRLSPSTSAPGDIWPQVEKKLTIANGQIQWSQLMDGLSHAINLLYISQYPTEVAFGTSFLSTQDEAELKLFRAHSLGPTVALSEYKQLWAPMFESYLCCLTKILPAWFSEPRLFHGPMSRDTSEKLLLPCKPGTFILRYSVKNSGLCLSSRRSDSAQFQHLELKRSEGNQLSIQWDKNTRRRYTCVEAIIWQSPLLITFYPDIPKSILKQKE